MLSLIWGSSGTLNYLGFFAAISDAALGTGFGVIDVALPLAISFFTFQQIAYLVDAHRGLTFEENPLKYALFVTFFPQLIAGPIVHHADVMGQYERAFRQGVRAVNVAVGLTLLAVGLFKKVVVADQLATYATPVFDAAAAGQTIGFETCLGGDVCLYLANLFRLFRLFRHGGGVGAIVWGVLACELLFALPRHQHY